MKNLLAIILIVIMGASCRYTTCEESRIYIEYQGKEIDKMIFNFKKYEKGSGFEKLLSTVTDSAEYKYSPYAGQYIIWAEPRFLDGNNDYIIEIPETGKVYKIYDITYSGKKKAFAGGTTSEIDTKCTRDISYKVNGTEYTVNGTVYSYGGYAERPKIIITK